MDEEAKQYIIINTHKGLFTYKVLPFGMSSGPTIFQWMMEGLLKDIPKVAVFLNYILLTGKDDTVHLQTLPNLLKWLQDVALRQKDQVLFYAEGSNVFGAQSGCNRTAPSHREGANN